MARDLGPRTRTGVQDGSVGTGAEQVNPYLPGTGWDVVFQPQDIAVPLAAAWEVYHIAVDGPIGSSGTLLINRQTWSFFAGWTNEWDPAQPIPVTSGQSLQFCWNVAFAAGPYNKTSNIQPVVTIWLRQQQEFLG